MALFGKKKAEEKKPVAKKTAAKKAAPKAKKAEKAAPAKVALPASTGNFAWVLKKPRITEKATIVPEVANAYVFEINPAATAGDVKSAIVDLYKVMPVRVNITKIATKEVIRRTRRKSKVGQKGGGKKAYVYLRKGDKIEFV